MWQDVAADCRGCGFHLKLKWFLGLCAYKRQLKCFIHKLAKCVETCMKNMEETRKKEELSNKLFQKFKQQRSKIVKDIELFLTKVLECLNKLKEEGLVTIAIGERLDRLIKSLCLIHALYGYPGTPVDNAVQGKSCTV